MRNRTEQILRNACLILAVLLLAQFIRSVFHVSSFFGIHAPAVPTLETNSVAGTKPAPTPGFRAAPSDTLTNTPVTKSKTETLTKLSTNLVRTKSDGTNLVSTNIVKRTATNIYFAATTNPAPKNSRTSLPPGMVARGIHFGRMPRMPGNQPALPPEIQARQDKIVESGFLAPVMHPLPMGLLGIAGDTAFLRTDSGQTGLVKEGDSLGDVKLLRIGINRILVEHDGRQEELTIFDGYGGDSLLSQKDKSSK